MPHNGTLFWPPCKEVCRYRRWTLLAAHVRTEHVHVVVQAEATPERVLNDFKVYASRRLSEAGFENSERKRWTRHGSTRYLWKREQVIAPSGTHWRNRACPWHSTRTRTGKTHLHPDRTREHAVFPLPIVTDRLLLRPFTADDCAPLREMDGDPVVLRYRSRPIISPAIDRPMTTASPWSASTPPYQWKLSGG